LAAIQNPKRTNHRAAALRFTIASAINATVLMGVAYAVRTAAQKNPAKEAVLIFWPCALIGVI
jgi:hypothetical protein